MFEIKESTVLNKTIWNLLFYNNSNAGCHQSWPDGDHALLDQEGNFSGFAACNNYKSKFQINYSSIKIGRWHYPHVLCQANGIMEEESGYTEMARSYEISGDVLILSDENQTSMAEYDLAEFFFIPFLIKFIPAN